MASQQLSLRALALVFLLFALQDAASSSSLHKILKTRDGNLDVSDFPSPSVLEKSKAAGGKSEAGCVSGPAVAIPAPKAQEFLAKLRRTKRNIWDRSRPDVQQWIQQFMYMGFDEQRLEADLSYWMDHARANDQGRQHHYDENAPIGPRDQASYRHGANVNYDYY